jgi:hypothetical protein
MFLLKGPKTTSSKGRKKMVVKSKEFCSLSTSDSDSDTPVTSMAAKASSLGLSDDDDDIFKEQKYIKKPQKNTSPPPSKKKPCTPQKQKQPVKKHNPLAKLPLDDNSPFVRQKTKPTAVSSRQSKGAENRPPPTQATALTAAPNTPTSQRSPAKPNRKRPHDIDVFDPKNEAFLAMPVAKRIKKIEEEIDVIKLDASSRQREVMADLDQFFKNEDRQAAMDRKRLHDAGRDAALKLEGENKKLHTALKHCEKQRGENEALQKQIRELREKEKKLAGYLARAEEARGKMMEAVEQARRKDETIKAEFENVSKAFSFSPLLMSLK